MTGNDHNKVHASFLERVLKEIKLHHTHRKENSCCWADWKEKDRAEKLSAEGETKKQLREGN
jgi:hypothetical protein